MTQRQRKTLSGCQCDSWDFWLVGLWIPPPLFPLLHSPRPAPLSPPFTLLLIAPVKHLAQSLVHGRIHVALPSLPLLPLSLLPQEVLVNTLLSNNSRGRPLSSELLHEDSWLWFICLFHTSEVRAGGRTVAWASEGAPDPCLPYPARS